MKKKIIVASLIVCVLALLGIYAFQSNTVNMAPGDVDEEVELQIS